MAHELDINNGLAGFVSAHESAWHQLGTTLDHTFTAEEAMEHGLLGGWNVRKQPMYITLPDGTPMEVPGRSAVIRDNPVVDGKIDVLGDVGDYYQIVQNEQHASFLNALVDESGAHFETAGSLYGGSQVFITMKLPGHIKIGGVDPVANYIAAINSHDGSKAFTLMTTPVRIVCANTMNMAFGSSSNIFRIRHTSGAEKALHQHARSALDITFNYLDEFQDAAEQLINTTMTQSKFEEIIEKEFGAADDASPSVAARADKKVLEISELFADAGTQEGIRDTAWAGFNALTEWWDHFSPVRGTQVEKNRAAKAILDPSFKSRALNLMMAAV